MGIYYVYVDDFVFVVCDPKIIITLLKEKYKYKLEGTGSILYHLVYDLFIDDEDILSMVPKKYIEKMMEGYTKYIW